VVNFDSGAPGKNVYKVKMSGNIAKITDASSHLRLSKQRSAAQPAASHPSYLIHPVNPIILLLSFQFVFNLIYIVLLFHCFLFCQASSAAAKPEECQEKS